MQLLLQTKSSIRWQNQNVLFELDPPTKAQPGKKKLAPRTGPSPAVSGELDPEFIAYRCLKQDDWRG